MHILNASFLSVLFEPMNLRLQIIMLRTHGFYFLVRILHNFLRNFAKGFFYLDLGGQFVKFFLQFSLLFEKCVYFEIFLFSFLLLELESFELYL